MSRRPPLVMLYRIGGTAEASGWCAFQTEASARGYAADIAVFLREPTYEERWSILGCLSHSTIRKVYDLRDLIKLPEGPWTATQSTSS